MDTGEPSSDWPQIRSEICKGALDRLIQDRFNSHLTDRVGKKLLCGEDTELTMALHLSLWKLRIDKRRLPAFHSRIATKRISAAGRSRRRIPVPDYRQRDPRPPAAPFDHGRHQTWLSTCSKSPN
jgi:hypothetical protein